MNVELRWWIAFGLFVLFMLALDLGIFHRKNKKITLRSALTWTGIWIILAVIFGFGIGLGWIGNYAPDVRQFKMMEFFTGYVVEESLSMDNVFIFAILFRYFKVPDIYQHRVLFWGVVGAFIMRAILIFAGIALIQRFEWIIYIFGVILIISGLKMLRHKDEEADPSNNAIFRLLRRWVPMTPHYAKEHFFIRENAKWLATPLFVVLVLIEWTDLIFAVDSIPAILAITQDSFIVYTSNVFAILGLRSLYSALSGLLGLFQYLHYGLSLILVFVGTKMLLTDIYHIPVSISLSFIIGILLLSIVLSIFIPIQKLPGKEKKIS